MDKFVSAVKGWVKFELVLTVSGMIGLAVSVINEYGLVSHRTSGSNYGDMGDTIVDARMMIYFISFSVLLARMVLLHRICDPRKEDVSLKSSSEEMGIEK